MAAKFVYPIDSLQYETFLVLCIGYFFNEVSWYKAEIMLMMVLLNSNGKNLKNI